MQNDARAVAAGGQNKKDDTESTSTTPRWSPLVIVCSIIDRKEKKKKKKKEKEKEKKKKKGEGMRVSFFVRHCNPICSNLVESFVHYPVLSCI